MTKSTVPFCTRTPTIIATNGIWMVCEDTNPGRLKHHACGFSRHFGFRANLIQIKAAEDDHRWGRRG